jgi:hypothetical protein
MPAKKCGALASVGALFGVYPCLKAYLISSRNSWAQVAVLTHHRVARTQDPVVERVSPPVTAWREAMSPQNPFDNPKLLIELAQAFESIWLVMRAHEPLLDEDRAKELCIEISRKLVELAADGVTDPAQLRRLALESLPLSPAH